VELTRYTQDLGLDLSEIPLEELRFAFPTLADVPTGERVSRTDLLLGFTISF
jgi:hypothetical protein